MSHTRPHLQEDDNLPICRWGNALKVPPKFLKSSSSFLCILNFVTQIQQSFSSSSPLLLYINLPLGHHCTITVTLHFEWTWFTLTWNIRMQIIPSWPPPIHQNKIFTTCFATFHATKDIKWDSTWSSSPYRSPFKAIILLSLLFYCHHLAGVPGLVASGCLKYPHILCPQFVIILIESPSLLLCINTFLSFTNCCANSSA